jgi:hypothetical protein
VKDDLSGIDQKLTFRIDAKGDIGSLSIKLEPEVKEIVFTRQTKKPEEKK